MSRLINPGPGDLSDRLSILALKILFGTEAAKDTKHWETERTVLLSKIRALTLNGAWFDAYTELAAVNAALWHAEDDLREIRNGPAFIGMRPVSELSETVAELAFRIQVLNDRRADLIGRINKDAGDDRGEEKL